jgi:hypothetical protein
MVTSVTNAGFCQCRTAVEGPVPSTTHFDHEIMEYWPETCQGEELRNSHEKLRLSKPTDMIFVPEKMHFLNFCPPKTSVLKEARQTFQLQIFNSLCHF